MNKYYVIKKGRQTGIFQNSWDDVKPLVDKFPNAIYKSFYDYDGALNYFNETDPICVNSNVIVYDAKHHEQEAVCRLLVYTDGSCRNNKGGYGIVVINDDNIDCYSGSVPIFPCTNQKAELYAILYVLQNIKHNEFVIHTDSKYAIGCCTNWLQNWKKAGFNKVKNIDLILEIDKNMQGKNVNFQHVYGHKGNKYNELCDELAKKYT
jgi:ribonuclease HI